MNLDNYRDFTRVIIIDDEQEEGEVMRKALAKRDVPSTFYHIEDTSDFPKKPLPNVRLIFLDLILERIGTPAGDTAKAKHALNNLKRFVGQENLYVLVIWSSKSRKDPIVEELKTLIQDDGNIASPLKTVTLNKVTYGVTPDGAVDFMAIQAKIEEELENIPTFKLFAEGERLANNGVALIISRLTQGKDNNNLSQIINSLSTAYSGKNLKDSKKPNAALLALNEVFQDAIEKKFISEDLSYLTVDGTSLSEEEIAPLNTSMIFSSDTSEGSGAIYQALDDKKDEIIEPLLAQKKEILNSEDPNIYDEKIIPIYIDVTPVCNAAQNKGNKYFIAGALHPNEYKSKKNITPVKDSCYQLGNYFLYEENGGVYKMTVNLKTYCTDSNMIEDLSPIKKIRSNIVIDIQHKIASYISRPGHLLL